jgi:putative SOS response-associated peptidase YedK
MCGRFVTASSPALLAERFHVDEVKVDDDEPNYNVAPRALVMAVRQRDDERVLSRLRWGLVPSWAKDVSMGDRMINARAETVVTKPAYKRAFAKKRCIIPADGFYEWKVVGPPSTPKGRPKKQPMFVHRRDGEPLAFAGLWEVWRVPDGPDGVKGGAAAIDGVGDDGWLRSCVIVTTSANDLLSPIHERMPVVLPESAWPAWLDPANDDTDALRRLLVPAPDDIFEVWPVSAAVNKADNNTPDLVRPVPPQ